MPAPRSMDREKPREPRIRVLPETGGGGVGCREKADKVWGPDPCPGEDQWAAGPVSAPRTEGTAARGEGVRWDLWAGMAQWGILLI